MNVVDQDAFQVPSTSDIRLLPALAEAIAEWFPELEGRSLAVSDATITKENTPTLPLVMCGFVKSMGKSPSNSYNGIVNVEDTFVVEFWLKPVRYKNDKGETPFWSYYPYEQIRDTLLTNITRWPTPNGERIAYRAMHLTADPFAVTLTFGFIASFQWCASNPPQGDPFKISFNLKPAPGICWPDEVNISASSEPSERRLGQWRRTLVP